jgi:hypothetical protein
MSAKWLFLTLLSVLIALPVEGQVPSPTNLSRLQTGSLLTIQSLTVKDGVISLIGTHGRTVSLPDGSFKGPEGSSIIVVTGRITGFTPLSGTPGILPGRPLKIESAVVESGHLFLIGTHGRKHNLPDGTFTGSDGAKIVVQDQNISGISGS